ncbi:hypothetical protein ABZ341_10250 [Streptomyces sp. NPDC006173]|uniref:Rv1733c family protein n=1 Tax=Streptomyces sp. NPDC006173 TaxID=3155349 RepID=UPI0033C3237D
MAAFRGPKRWLWRWRRNPLRRRGDALESWVLLVAWVFTLFGGVVTGLAATQAVEDGLTGQRAAWHSATARLTEDAPPTTESGARVVWAKARWTTADGAPRSGQVRVRTGSAAGTPVAVWTDREGRLVSRPATAAQARVRASLVGALVGVSAAGIPFATGRLVRAGLERRRLDQWDTEWRRIGPLWSRMTS